LALALLIVVRVQTVGADPPTPIHIRPTGPDSAVVLIVSPDGSVTVTEIAPERITPLLSAGSASRK
jgi:hypothetical protein